MGEDTRQVQRTRNAFSIRYWKFDRRRKRRRQDYAISSMLWFPQKKKESNIIALVRVYMTSWIWRLIVCTLHPIAEVEIGLYVCLLCIRRNHFVRELTSWARWIFLTCCNYIFLQSFDRQFFEYFDIKLIRKCIHFVIIVHLHRTAPTMRKEQNQINSRN